MLTADSFLSWPHALCTYRTALCAMLYALCSDKIVCVSLRKSAVKYLLFVVVSRQTKNEFSANSVVRLAHHPESIEGRLCGEQIVCVNLRLISPFQDSIFDPLSSLLSPVLFRLPVW